MKLLIGLLLLALPLQVSAEVYSWTDAKGTVHFTEDIAKVPRQYRKKLAVRGEDLQSAPLEAAPRQEAVNTGEVSPAAPAVVAEKPGAGTSETTASYAGRSASSWQAAFREKRAAVQAIDDQIRQLQTEMTSPTSLITPAKAAELNARRTELMRQYESAAASLNQLVDQANKAGLPPEFSR